MIDKFMKYPGGNTLAVIVLIALVIAWFISLLLSLGNVPVQTNKGWFPAILPIFAFLGIPAAYDLLQTTGIVLLFAVIVTIVFLLNIVIPILHRRGTSSHSLINDWYKWAIPISVLGGLVVSGYLTFVESTGAGVACGDTLGGGCNDVQSSKYAILLGVVPVGLLGFMGNLAILAAWIAWQYGPYAIKKLAALAGWGMCIFGVLFSIYLTFLEPFVICATCMWCISSAVVMIILLLVSTPAAQQALALADDEE
jgi:uncharacterized membrane protein